MSITHIPYYDFSHRQPLYEAFIERQKKILLNERMLEGRNTQLLEQQIAYRLGFKYAIACSSGTAALYAISRYLKTYKGVKRAYVPEVTFQSVYGAIASNELDVLKTPVNENYLSDFEPMQDGKSVSVVTGLLGQNTFTIPDSGHLIFDASQNWQGLHHRRDHTRYEEAFVAISFDPSKSLGGFMDGGMILTNDEVAQQYFNHLTRMRPSTSLIKEDVYSLNFRMSEVGAMYLELQLPRIDVWLEKRKTLAQAFDRIFGEAAIQRHYPTDEVQKYAIRIKDAVAAKELALKWGIEVKPLYPQSNATALLGLPVYPNLPIQEATWRFSEYHQALRTKGLL